MDKRLKIILDMIEDGIGCVDVGTDHGYIPIELYKREYNGNIIATDINSGPLEVAKLNAGKAGIDCIDFHLCDGLENIDYNLIDTVVIAGMGGDLICDIIDKAEWTMNSKFHLILQPMSKSEVLRYWLVNNGYIIQREEHYDIYSIISVRFFDQNSCYNDSELYVGKTPSEKVLAKQINYLSKKSNSEFFRKIYEELYNDYSKKYL